MWPHQSFCNCAPGVPIFELFVIADLLVCGPLSPLHPSEGLSWLVLYAKQCYCPEHYSPWLWRMSQDRRRIQVRGRCSPCDSQGILHREGVGEAVARLGLPALAQCRFVPEGEGGDRTGLERPEFRSQDLETRGVCMRPVAQRYGAGVAFGRPSACAKWSRCGGPGRALCRDAGRVGRSADSRTAILPHYYCTAVLLG